MPKSSPPIWPTILVWSCCTGARYSPHDNPVERVWAALKAFIANTAVTWPGRLRQIHAFFRARSPDQFLTAAIPEVSPWLPAGYKRNYWNAA